MATAARHYWIMVLDIESFSARSNSLQESLREAMYQVFAEALEEAGLHTAEHGDPETAVHAEDRGDGILALVPSAVPPVRLVGTFVRALREGLEQRAAIHSAVHSMRFRFALHQGLVSRDRAGWSGDAVNMACRLVDAEPLREVLRAAAGSHLAVIVSEEIYRGVVRHGYRGVDPAAYLPLRFGIKGGAALTGWVTVPGLPAPPGVPADGMGPTAERVPRGAYDGTHGGTETGARGYRAEQGASPGTTSADGRRSGPAEPAPAESVPVSAETAPAERPAPGERAARSVTFNAGTVHGDQVAGDKNITVRDEGRVRP